ncbi:MAG: CTP synthase [Treponemataceae bacterium]
MNKYIFVTGGVCSSLGKGVAASSLGSLLECSGLTVAMMKCDPYINVDAGNMSPYQHGEVYVTDDGAETDLDLGTYARFTNAKLTKANSVTTGKIYNTVIKNERAGRYNGRTVQVIPHITDEIKRRIVNVAQSSNADILIVEIGGTVGDIESIPFLEAARQLIREFGKQNAICMHMTLVPEVTGGELKTKPTQHSVKHMQQIGIQPDILLCRAENQLDDELEKKIALFCNVDKGAVFTSSDVKSTVYELPLYFHQQGLCAKVLKKLGLGEKKTNPSIWKDFLAHLNHPKSNICIAMIGKKGDLNDYYKSVREALFHAATQTHQVSISIKKINAEEIENSTNSSSFFEGIDGIIIPGNYGQRGFLGMLCAVQFARENNIPYFGIDLGMQLMAVETARNLLDWKDADSTEFVSTTDHPIVSLQEEQTGLVSPSVMRLGSENVTLKKKSKVAQIYKKEEIAERHRNKYEFDPHYTPDMEKNQLLITGLSKNKSVEVFEWEKHPFGIGVQFHPEFLSKPSKPHPLFSAFIGATLKK